MEVESESEPEPDYAAAETVAPETATAELPLGEAAAEVSEEQQAQAQDLFSQGRDAINSGDFAKAVDLLTQSVVLDSSNNRAFALRARALVLLQRPAAAIRDASHALTLNPDSAMALKWLGRAHALLGHWTDANKSLGQSNSLNFDEEIVGWLKTVKPNAVKMADYLRRKDEKHTQRRQAKLRKQREQEQKAACHADDDCCGGGSGGAHSHPHSQPAGGFPAGARPSPAGPGGMGGMGGMPGGMPAGFAEAMQDPEVITALQDPEIMAALQDCMGNPANFAKYMSNPRIMSLITKMSSKFGGAMPGMPGAGAGFGAGGFPGFPGGSAPSAGGFSGFPGGPASTGFPGGSAGPKSHDDDLD